MPLSPYTDFTRDEWSRLRNSTPLTLTEDDLTSLRGINVRLSLREVEEIYLPLSRLLNLYVAATQSLHEATHTFLGDNTAKVPYVIGVAGSVAVGKSTTARILQALLARWRNHPKVDLITTDGFLYSTAVLESRGLMKRKGFPESYDRRRLVKFVADVKSGEEEVTAPIYSHLIYDIIPDQAQTIRQPDIMIVEGLNVLQIGIGNVEPSPVFVSDYFDFSIYVDADEEHIKRWYVERFLTLRRTAFRDPVSYFHRYASLSDAEARQTALDIWEEINGPNLRENILPTRTRADLILKKGVDHSIQQVKLRKL
ncbi:MAG TPA: type I pantothenate kinase [Blastocatellia bacterium]|nr:type I pantothenate kinase [Blastocatellia bacterium]HMV82097.1 type I pantothenate kinase [Blastocatellia bacterium]HMX24425.1 type I pantothenate kinase [Blastocatellia bacterium]HMY74978.1 type I pantothenate kinase [Blastocatellia bacterium]HNG29114.1 type I pantothenate kinase [Blastocatellia bacterium]